MKCTLSISLGNPSDLPEKPDSNLEFLASQNSVLKGGGVGALAYAHKPHLKGPHVHKGRPRWHGKALSASPSPYPHRLARMALGNGPTQVLAVAWGHLSSPCQDPECSTSVPWILNVQELTWSVSLGGSLCGLSSHWEHPNDPDFVRMQTLVTLLHRSEGRAERLHFKQASR